MKKSKIIFSIITLIIIASITLTGCGKASDTSESSSNDSFKYNIERMDYSQTSSVDSSLLSMTQYYDLLTIENEGEAASQINKSIENDYNDFKSTLNQTQEYFSERDEWLKSEENSSDYIAEEYINTVEARVSQNDGKVFSVVYSSEWYMGGVCNANTNALTFSSSTGEKLNLAEYLDVSEDQAMKYVLNTIAKEMNNNPDDFNDNSYEEALALSVEDIDFYIEKDKVYICFDTYEIACGAYGSFVFELLMSSDKTEEDVKTDANKDKWYFSLDSDSNASIGIGIYDYDEDVYSAIGSDISSESDIVYEEDIMDGPFESYKATLTDGTNLYFKRQVEDSEFFYLCGISTTNSNIKFGRGICVGMTEEQVRALIPDFSASNSFVYAKDQSYIEDEIVNYAVSNGDRAYFSAEKNDNVINLCSAVIESDWIIYDMILEFKEGKVSKIKLSDGYVTYPEFV